jgi:hypothetical protein
MIDAQQLFEQLAATTWDTLESAHRNRFQFGEDAITSVNLHAIVNSGATVLAFEDTRAPEEKKGCDFELWVGTNVSGWYRYAAQAKRIDIRTRRYGKLKHAVGGQLQIDILHKYAMAVRAMPIYCLYSYSSNVQYWNCSAVRMEKKQLGCMVTPSVVIEEAVKRRGGQTFAFLHRLPESLPWRCLVHCLNQQPVGAGECVRKHLRELGTLRWPSSATYWHRKLPQHIEKLWTERLGQRAKQASKRDLPPGAARFITHTFPDGEMPSRPSADDQAGALPRWTLVVDTAYDVGM